MYRALEPIELSTGRYDGFRPFLATRERSRFAIYFNTGWS